MRWLLSDAYRLRIGGDAKVYYVRQGEKRGSIIGDTRDIKPMPQKKKPKDPDETWEELHQRWGYNACLEDITGETE